MDLFDAGLQARQAQDQPLAARLRPRNLDEYIGQEHILGPGRLLHRVPAVHHASDARKSPVLAVAAGQQDLQDKEDARQEAEAEQAHSSVDSVAHGQHHPVRSSLLLIKIMA